MVEFEWVVAKLLEIDRLSGYDGGRVQVDMLRNAWNAQDIDPWLEYQRLSGRTGLS